MSKKINKLCTSSPSPTAQELAENIRKKPLPYSNDVLPAFTHDQPKRVLLFSQAEGFEHAKPSCHERFVLVFTLHGDGTVLLDGKMLNMPQDTGLLIFPYQFHQFVNNAAPGLSWLLITFESDDADYLLPLQNRCIPINPVCLREIALMLPDFRNTKMPDKVKSPILSARAQIILYALLSGVSPQKNARPASQSISPNQPMYEVIRKVAEKVSQNLERNYSVNDAAEDVGISVSYLQKIFHKILGAGVGVYIRRHKIFHSARLLKSTNMTISEVSLKCGFDSLYSFSRSFKSIMKSSPRDFRNNPASRVGNAYSQA